MKAYTHPSGHLRLSLTKEEQENLRYILADYQEMLASFDAESLGHGDLGVFAESVSKEIHRAMNHAEVEKRFQQFKRKGL